MSVKLVMLKSGETLISDAKEMFFLDMVKGYVLNHPHTVELRKTLLLVEENENPKGDLEVILSPWIPLSSDTQITVAPDWVVAIVEPIQNIKELYEEKVNGKNSQVSLTEG